MSAFVKPVFLPFVEEIGLCTTEVDDLWTSVSVLFEDGTFGTVVCV